MFKLKYSTFSELISPYKTDSHKIYDFFVNVKNLPKGLPTKVNPRKVKTTTKVYKSIVSGLINDDHSFYLDNRGMFITAKDIRFSGHCAYLNLDDITKYGIVDGGHTYHAIINNRSKIARDKNVYVHIEVITGVSNIVELARDRNTNVQVQDKAIANLAGKFDQIKKVLSGTFVQNKVSYTQNDVKKYKPIDVIDIIALMYSITYHSKLGKQPVNASGSKKGMIRDYLECPNKYENVISYVPEFLKLYDFIEKNIRNAYKQKKLNGHLGVYQGFYHLKKETFTKFYSYKTREYVTKPILMSIFSGLRSIFKKNRINNYIWIADPYKSLKIALPNIVNFVVSKDGTKGGEQIRLGRNRDVYVYAYDHILLSAVKLEH